MIVGMPSWIRVPKVSLMNENDEANSTSVERAMTISGTMIEM